MLESRAKKNMLEFLKDPTHGITFGYEYSPNNTLSLTFNARDGHEFRGKKILRSIDDALTNALSSTDLRYNYQMELDGKIRAPPYIKKVIGESRVYATNLTVGRGFFQVVVNLHTNFGNIFLDRIYHELQKIAGT